MPRRPLAITLALVLTPPTIAGVGSDLDHYYDTLGYNSKINHPSAYKGQEADYYSGGSLTIKSGIRDSNLLKITLPDIKAGCGGIDMFSGGFSHINSNQLSKMGKAVIANALPFAVDLALQTWAPQIKGIKDRLQSIADQFNELSVNSCESAQSSVSGLWPFKNQASQKYICNTLGSQNNAFSDWAEGMNKCGQAGTSHTMLNQAKKDPALNGMVKRNTNLIWFSLQKQTALASDTELAEFFMTLSGTIVYDDKGNISRYPSLLANNNNVIDTLLNGGTIKRYQCQNKTTCLAPRKVDFTLNAQKGLKMKLTRMLGDIVARYQSDNALTLTQQGFIEMTQLPVLKMMVTTLEAGQTPSIPAYAEVMAKDLINHYLSGMLATLQRALDNSLLDKDDSDSLLADIAVAQTFLARVKNDAMNKLLLEQALVTQSQQIEKQIEGAFSARSKASLRFGE